MADGATDPPRTDAFGQADARAIGSRVAAQRGRRGLSVASLARRIGVSRSMVSQIERGQSRPSVSTLFALAETLDVPVDAFFRDVDDVPPAAARETRTANGAAGAPASEAGAVGGAAAGSASEAGAAAAPASGDRYLVRRDARAVIDIEGGVRWERLTPRTLDEVEFLELVYAPHAESNATLYRHPGIEMVLVLSGRLDIFVAFEHYELGPGDSIWFPSTTPHRYRNPTHETTRAVTVLLRDPPPGAVQAAAGGPPLV